MCEVCGLKLVKPVFWSTNTMRYLYSALSRVQDCLVLYLGQLSNDICYFLKMVMGLSKSKKKLKG